MAQESRPIEVTDASEDRRYEIRLGDQLAGYARYRDAADGRRILVHTEVDDAFEGQGLGGRLARGALDDIRAHGWTVTPTCPFIAGYIDGHPEYADLVDARS